MTSNQTRDYHRNESGPRRKPSSPTQKSVSRVTFLLVCLLVAFGIQNVIFSNMKNTSVIRSPNKLFAMNLIICLVIFAILLAINKQPRQNYNDSSKHGPSDYSESRDRRRRSSLLENNKCKVSCVESRLFCTSLFCCCYCCFNFSEEDKRSSENEVSHHFRKSLLIPIAPWIHAIAVFLNVR